MGRPVLAEEGEEVLLEVGSDSDPGLAQVDSALRMDLRAVPLIG